MRTVRETSVDLEVDVGPNDVVELTGEFDLAGVEAFRAAAHVALHGQREVIIDMTRLRFVDSSGIRAILDLATAAPDTGIVLRAPQPNVRKVISLTGIEGHAGIRIE